MLNPSRTLVISLVHPAVSSVVYPASGSAFVARTQGAPIVQLSGRPRTRPRAARRRREAAELPAGCTSPTAAVGFTPSSERVLMFDADAPHPLAAPIPIATPSTTRIGATGRGRYSRLWSRRG